MSLKRTPKSRRRRSPKRIRSIRARIKLALLDLRKKLVGLNPTKMTDKLPKRKSKRRRRSRRRLTQGKRIRKEMKIKFHLRSIPEAQIHKNWFLKILLTNI